MPSSRTRRALVAGVSGVCGAFVAAAVAACGHQAVLAPGHVLGVAVFEYRLRPAHILVPAGELRVAVSDDGRLSHSLVIARPTATTLTRTTSTGTVVETTTVAAATPDLAPGESTTLTVTLPAGRYPIYSGVGADSSLGASGTLTVARAGG